VDEFTQPPGQPAQDSVLDRAVTPELVETVDASAIEFLVLWRRADGCRRRTERVHSSVELRRAQVLAVLARGRGARHPDRTRSIGAGARRISAALDIPWVVLSNGGAADAFPDAVAAVCSPDSVAPPTYPGPRLHDQLGVIATMLGRRSTTAGAGSTHRDLGGSTLPAPQPHGREL
jgi:tagatose-1,6-bisphosphate aldolase